MQQLKFNGKNAALIIFIEAQDYATVERFKQQLASLFEVQSVAFNQSGGIVSGRLMLKGK